MAAEAPPATLFAAFQRVSHEAALVRRRRSWTIGISLGLHSLVLVAAAAGAFSRPVPPPQPESPRVVVSLGRPALPRRAPPPPEAPKLPPPRKPAPRPVMALVQPQVHREIPRQVEEQAPVVDETDDAGIDEIGDEQPVGQPHGVAAVTVPAPPPPAPPAPPAMTADQRRQRLARYLQEALRPRFDSRFDYPPEAERMGVEGRVTLRLTIDCSGRLLSAAAAACPSEILCEHAERTIKEASPFPPPPAELGSNIQVEMPIAYRLD